MRLKTGHFKKKKGGGGANSGPHFTLEFDDDKLFFFGYTMNFWVKQNT